LGDGEVVLVVVAAVLGVWSRSVVAVGAVALVAGVASKRTLVLITCLAMGCVGAWRSQVEWREAVPLHIGRYAGWVSVVGESSE